MGTLGDHYYGEGNASRCIGKSERIRNSIHYKNERSMSFSVFLGKLQKIINIFTDQKDPHYEEMKVRFLFNIVQHTALSAAIEALKVSDSIGGTNLTFTKAANHLAAQVSVLPEFLARGRGISAMKR